VKRFFASGAAPGAPWRARDAGDDYGRTATPDWRGIDWLAHLHRARLGGAEVNYVDIGDGPSAPVVFVHGLGGQWQNWLENIPRVSRERRVIAPDLPGFGLSPEPPERITISGYGRLVDALCERLGLGPVHLVGNSMGGFVAAETAIQVPEHVERLVLVSAAGISSTNVYTAPALLLGRAAGALTSYTAAGHDRVARRPRARHAALALVARYPARLKADLAYEGFMKGAGKPGFDAAFRASLEYDFRDRLPEIRCPTLIVWGENDAILPVRDAQEFERLIPDSRKLLMRDTGHVPMAERPDAFNNALLEFLAETGPAEARERVEGESQAA
jgi:pimeloyl-ACP methyl ester carboxylesterase